MPSGIGVATTFTGKDLTLTQAMIKLEKRVDKFGIKSDKAFKKASRSARGFGSVLKGVLGAQVISRGVGLLTQGMREVTSQFISFDDSIVSASAKFSDLNLATKEGQRTMDELKKTAREVGETTQFTATQAAKGLDNMALAGFTARQSMALLKPMVDLSTVAQVDFNEATEIAVKSLGAFGLRTKDTAKLTANFARVNDVLSMTTARSAARITDLFESIQAGAPEFIASGQELETFTTLLAKMADSSIVGSRAGTLLRNAMLRLANPTKEARSILGQLGVTVKDEKNNFRDFIDILADFEKGTKGLGDVQKAAALDVVFGKKAIGGMTIALQVGSKALREFRDEQRNAAGSSKDMADIIRLSLGNRLKALKSAAVEVGFRFLDAFDERGAKAIERLTESLRNFDVKPLISGMETVLVLLDKLDNKIVRIRDNLELDKAVFLIGKMADGLKVVNSFLTSDDKTISPLGLRNEFLTTAAGLGVGFLGDLLGGQKSVLGDLPAHQIPSIPPNQAEAKAQNIQFQGLIKFENPPAGATFETSTVGAPKIQVDGLGAN